MVPVLFADVNWETVLTAAVSFVAGGGLLKLLDWLRDSFVARRKEDRADEDAAIVRYQELLRRVDADRADCVKENARLEARVDAGAQKTLVLTIKVERQYGWIRSLEAKLDAAGIPYDKFDPDSPPAADAPRLKTGDTPPPFVPTPAPAPGGPP